MSDRHTVSVVYTCSGQTAYAVKSNSTWKICRQFQDITMAMHDGVSVTRHQMALLLCAQHKVAMAVDSSSTISLLCTPDGQLLQDLHIQDDGRRPLQDSVGHAASPAQSPCHW